jgi:hypothetical protein
MQHPELIIDGDGDVWALNVESMESGEAYYEHGMHGYESLKHLIRNYGPVHALSKGDKLEPPFKPIANGVWVDFAINDATTVEARVYRYDPDKKFYEVIVIAEPDDLKEQV